MSLDTKTEKARNLAFILSEPHGTVAREVRTIASGEGVLEAGMMLGKVTASGKYVASPNAEVVGKEGAETAVAILGYTVDATSADAKAVIVDGVGGVEVKASMLLVHSSVNDATKRNTKLTQLRAVGIKAR
ncbi:head decoration protein [Microvirga sp. RSM25]|uniref:head decoration protein n=1 Tax=Microvirga sp. RSM25 TaxID=3273802 RepID=UPI00384BD53C